MAIGNALVSGSTSGMGLIIARELVKNNYNVMLHGQLSEGQDIEQLLAEMRTYSSAGAIIGYDGSDVRDKAQVRQLIKNTEREIGEIDVLINNAGIQYVADTSEFPDDKWDAIIDINLSAYLHTIKQVITNMRKKNYGRIINIASTHGIVASPNKSAYVAAKHGVIGLTKVVALENANYNITCNAIRPGFVLTPLVERQIIDEAAKKNHSFEEEKIAFVSTKHPSGRFVSEQEVADAVMLVIKCGSMTGASTVIDGGWTVI